MIISFDIDDTLIPCSWEFDLEKPTLITKLLGAEPLRKGTITLFSELENQGFEIWIYTTSFRTKWSLSKTFWAYGLKPRRIINETINQKLLRKHQCKTSKNPKLFGIDTHVDDSKGVWLEGQQVGFKVIHVKPDDQQWVETIFKELSKSHH